MAKRYTVQVNEDDQWFDCVREDLTDEFDGDTRNLPPATFDTLDEAQTFIVTLCGLMHCGGDPALFRVDERDA